MSLNTLSPGVFITCVCFSFSQRSRCWNRVILPTLLPVHGWDTQTRISERCFCFFVFKSHFSGCRSSIGLYIVYNVKTVFLQLCTDALKNGWTKFKVKVGADLEDDIRRCCLVRQMIGPDNTLVWLLLHLCSIYVIKKQNYKTVSFWSLICQMIDANQRWDVAEAISWVSSLAEFKPLWIEEPTSPDDILGHAAIAKVI